MTNNVPQQPGQQQKQPPKPVNEIDLQALTTEPRVSSDYMSDRIRNKFRSFAYVLDKDGQVVHDKNGNPQVQMTEDLWATMELFTQDWRLGNLSKEESVFVRYHIDLCTDVLTVLPGSFAKPALIMLERAIAVTETSQSKGGFLRRMFNTFFQNSTVKEEKPEKRNFFGLGKKQKVEG